MWRRRWREAGLPRVQGDDISFKSPERRSRTAGGRPLEEAREKETNQERSKEDQGEGKGKEQKIIENIHWSILNSNYLIIDYYLNKHLQAFAHSF